MVEQPAAADGTTARSLRLLVVDDNPDITESMAMLLEILGHQASVENDSHAALARVAREAFDVCLLDVGMPRMDGLELARRIRATVTAGQPVLIAITGFGDRSDRLAALEAGFDRVLVKPLRVESLTAILADLVPAASASG